MKRIFTILFFVFSLGLIASGQNLVQNPSFENPTWDEYWVLSLTAPSSATAEATQVTSDAHEGTTSVELHNTVNTKWTYYYTDTINAPISLIANKRYEVKGWLRSVETAKNVDFSIFWNGSANFQIIYAENPDPVTNPDWFMVKDTITPLEDVNDAYLRLGLRADRATDGSGMGRLLFDDFSVTLIPDGNETEIEAFSFPGQVLPEIIDRVAGTVSIQMPYGTNPGILAPDNITLSAGASISPAVGVPQDFRSPVIYTVTALDGSTTRDWTVTVTVPPPSTATAITSFTIPELVAPVTIHGSVQLILGTVAYGSDIANLVPSIVVSPGATVNPASGVANDFTNPVSYMVVAQDGITSQDWVVAIKMETNTETDIVSFEMPELVSPAVIDPVLHTVTATVPFGTDLRALVPTIGVSGGATIDPASEATRDFSTSVSYTVTAEDGIEEQVWTVTVIEGFASSETDITAFTIPEMASPAIIDDAAHTVRGSVPYGTDVSALVPTIEVSSGASISPASDVAMDFTSSVIYTVTAQDGTTVQIWTVDIQILPNTETDIISFDIPELVSAATIDPALHTVVGTVPYGTDITALVPAIEVSPGATINPLSGASSDFSSPVIYTVTADDGITLMDWTISITVAPNTETDITGFTLAEQTTDATIDLLAHTVTIEVAAGTDLRFLTPIISLSAGATIGPLSGVSRDFTTTVMYTVTAEDGVTAQVWTVEVTLAPANTETDITAFSIPQLLSPAVIDYSLHTVVGTVAYGVDLTARVPTIAVSQGASIDPGSGEVTDLSTPVRYTVTAEDGITTQDWLVTIQALPNTETDITEFSLAEETGAAIINNTDHTIDIEVEKGSDVTSLIPTISVSPDATIDPASGISRDFTNTVEYNVTAQDGINSQVWQVRVSVHIPLGIGTREDESIRIYPNPASEFVFIELSRDTQIRMHNLLGKLCYSADHVNGDHNINVSEFEKGIYIVSLYREDGSLQQSKLIIQ